MMRMMWVGVLSVLAFTGCSSEASNSSSEASALATSSMSSVAAGATATASSVPARRSDAADTPPLATPRQSPEPMPEDAGANSPQLATPPKSPEPSPAPEANVALPPEGTDMPHGEALYLDICQRFLPAIDALESSGAAGREQSVAGMRGEMESNQSWSTVSAEDQQEIVRGLTAAGNGSC